MTKPHPTDRTFYERLGARIRELRLSGRGRPMSQYQLAKKLRVNQNTVSRWESGEYRPTLLDALEIARFFGIPFKSPLVEDRDWNLDDGDYGLDGEIRRGLPDLSEQDKKDVLAFMRVRREASKGQQQQVQDHFNVRSEL
jgi:transcriptional regulator with XRE-family HTH domain